MDREEFYRLKKVKGLKERAQANEEEERAKKRRASDKENEGGGGGNAEDGGKNVLGDDGDEDLIF